MVRIKTIFKVGTVALIANTGFLSSSALASNLISTVTIAQQKGDDSIETAINLADKGEYGPAVNMVRRLEAANTQNIDYYKMAADVFLKATRGGECVDAIVKARLLGANYDRTALMLAKGYLVQKMFPQTLEALKGRRFKENELYEASLIKADALLSLKQRKEAEILYRQAVQIDGNKYESYLGLSRMALQARAVKDAEQFAAIAIQKAPNETMAHYTMGLVKRFQGNFSDAKGYFDKAIELFPSNTLARLERASILINSDQVPSAEADLDIVYTHSPKNQMALYLSAVIEARRGNLDQADLLLNKASTLVGKYLPATYVRGLVSFQKGHYALAETFLMLVLREQPRNVQVIKTAATAQIRQKKYSRAYKTLAGYLRTDTGKTDPVALNLAGIAYMGAGNFVEGTRYFEAAVKYGGTKVKVGAKDPIAAIENKLALAKYAAGRTSEAITSFEKSAKTGGVRELAILAAVYLKEKKYSSAIDTATKLTMQFPNRAIGYNLLGSIYLDQKQYDQAIVVFNKALGLNDKYMAASRNIAIAYLALGQASKAEVHLQKLVESSASDFRAKALLGKALMNQGKWEKAVPYFRLAHRELNNAPELTADLAISLLKINRPDEASQVAIDGALKYTNNPDVVAKLAGVLMETGQVLRATQLFARVVAFKPADIDSQLSYGRSLVKARLFAGARSSFARVQSMAKVQKRTISGLAWYQAELEMSAGRLDRAEILYPSLKNSDRPTEVPVSLKGAILFNLSKFKEAEVELEQALKSSKFDQSITTLLVRTKLVLEKDIEAVSLLREWLKERPDQLEMRISLAKIYESQNQIDRAISTYREIFKMGIVNADIAAHLARLLIMQDDIEAVAMAEYAYKTKPKDPYIISTYGLLLLHTKRQYLKATVLFKQAIKRAPGVAENHYFLGLAYRKERMREKAIEAFNTALKLSNDFKGADEARRLLLVLE